MSSNQRVLLLMLINIFVLQSPAGALSCEQAASAFLRRPSQPTGQEKAQMNPEKSPARESGAFKPIANCQLLTSS